MVLQKDLVLDTLLDVGMNKQELQKKSSLVYAAYATVSAFASGFNACSRTWTKYRSAPRDLATESAAGT